MLGTKDASPTSAGAQGSGEAGARLTGDPPKTGEAVGGLQEGDAWDSLVLAGPSCKAGGTFPGGRDRRPNASGACGRRATQGNSPKTLSGRRGEGATGGATAARRVAAATTAEQRYAQLMHRALRPALEHRALIGMVVFNIHRLDLTRVVDADELDHLVGDPMGQHPASFLVRQGVDAAGAAEVDREGLLQGALAMHNVPLLQVVDQLRLVLHVRDPAGDIEDEHILEVEQKDALRRFLRVFFPIALRLCSDMPTPSTPVIRVRRRAQVDCSHVLPRPILQSSVAGVSLMAGKLGAFTSGSAAGAIFPSDMMKPAWVRIRLHCATAGSPCTRRTSFTKHVSARNKMADARRACAADRSAAESFEGGMSSGEGSDRPGPATRDVLLHDG